MYRSFLPFLALLFFSCKSTSYFIVRHAEKAEATMSSDVPLSDAGRQRAQALRDLLKNEDLTQVWSTNYIRTRSTAQPIADATGNTVQTYHPGDTSFISKLKAVKKGKVLVVGHSNTVDDLVNQLMGTKVIPSDLSETEYGDLFVVKRKGKKYYFEKRHFGL